MSFVFATTSHGLFNLLATNIYPFYTHFSYLVLLRDFLRGRSYGVEPFRPHIRAVLSVTLTLLISATHFRVVRALLKWFVLVAYSIWLYTHYSIILLCMYYNILILFCQYTFAIVYNLFTIGLILYYFLPTTCLFLSSASIS